jgi:hypothetical protein
MHEARSSTDRRTCRPPAFRRGTRLTASNPSVRAPRSRLCRSPRANGILRAPAVRSSGERRRSCTLAGSVHSGTSPTDATQAVGGDGGESNSPSRTLRRRPLRACPMVCRRPPGRASALCRTVQSRAPRSGLTPDYVTLVRIAAPLGDASTTREAEAASTLTLLPKQRERESTGGCQVLLFAT